MILLCEPTVEITSSMSGRDGAKSRTRPSHRPEAVVSIALGTLRNLLLEDGKFLYGVGDEVKELEIQLKEMKCFLEDADRRRHESKTIFNWISEIKELAYRAESAIERHAARVSWRRSRRGLRELIRRYSCILEEYHSIHQLGSEISKIKSHLGRVTKDMRAYGITNIIDRGEGSALNHNKHWLRKTFPDFEMDDCFVGMEEELKLLESLLVEDKEHRVISVWGMGGSGKTTIARKVYNHIKETNNGCFECFAWVCISQQCQIRSVLEDILSQLRPQKVNENIVGDTVLMGQLCGIQREKRCLIVVDDLWETSHWDGFKHAFLVQDLQSKILVTTRERKVAEVGFAVEHGLLHMGEALELLKKKAFPHTNIPGQDSSKDKGKRIARDEDEDDVFQVCRVMKYYALCVDLKKERVHVLDSQNESEAQIKEEKYTRTVDELKQMLVDYMTNINEVHKSIIVKRSKMSIVHIKWGDVKNINDTGVYLMRHMETFIGEGAYSWSCGLTAKLKKQLNLLRVRYCATIIGWEKNSVKDDVTVSATDYYEEVVGDPSINIDMTLLG